MPNKQVNELDALESVNSDDLVPVYDSDSTSSERLMQVTQSNLIIPKSNPGSALIEVPIPICIAEINAPIAAIGANGYTVVTAADFLRTVVDNTAVGGGPPYLYGFNKVGDVPDVTHADPRDAYVEFDCTNYAGTPVICEVWVADKRGYGGGYANYTEVTVNITDLLFAVCAP